MDSNFTINCFNITNENFSEICEFVHEQELECPGYVILDFFHRYYIPLIVAGGFIGNSLSCIVFLTTYLKMRSSSYYLAALSIADSCFLFVLLIVNLTFNGVTDLYNRYIWCKLLVYVSSVCSSWSVWLIVAFTIERFIAVQYPLQRPHICTVARAKMVVSMVFAIAALTHIYAFWTAGLVKVGEEEVCELLLRYHGFMQTINFLDTIVSLICPVILIITMNTMIARNLKLFSRRFQGGSLDECLCEEPNGTQDRSQTHSSSSNRGVSFNSQNSRQSGMVSNLPPMPSGRKYRMEQPSLAQSSQPTKNRSNSSGRNLLSSRNQQSITKMLLVISTVFVALNMPSYVIRLCVYYGYSLWDERPPDGLWCGQQYAMLLFYTNYSINFLLYAMCGITFRRCLRHLLSKYVLILSSLTSFWRREQRDAGLNSSVQE